MYFIATIPALTLTPSIALGKFCTLIKNLSFSGVGLLPLWRN